MDFDASVVDAGRDLRSRSIPRLRFHSHKAKYGGAPPIDAFTLLSPPNHLQTALGPATTDLKPAQKYMIAQSTVGRLIGKRVNKKNQRTGERNPWNYYGTDRRWAKQEAKGAHIRLQDGVDIWSGEKSEAKRARLDVERMFWDADITSSEPLPTREVSLELSSSGADNVVDLKNDLSGVTLASQLGQKQIHSDCDGLSDGWEIVSGFPIIQYEREDGDDWELVTVNGR